MAELTMPSVSSGTSTESLQRYCYNHRVSFVSSLLVCSTLAVALWSHVHLHDLFIWLSLVILSQAGQAWHTQRYLRAEGAHKQAKANWMPGLMLGSLATGVAWSTGFYLLGLSAGDLASLLLIFTIAGVTGFGGLSKAHVLPLALAFEAAVLLPMSVWLFMQDDGVTSYMGIISLLYMALLYFMLRQINAMALNVQSMNTRNMSLSEALARVQQLEREGAMLRNMVDIIADPAIMVHDPEQGGRTVYANAAACAHLGVDREALYELTPSDFDVRIDDEKKALIEERLARDGRFAFQSVHRRSNGEEVPVEVVTSRFTHEGTSLGVTFVRNISARLAAETRMRDLEITAMRDREFRSLAENLPVAVIRYDRAHNRSYINSAAERMLHGTADTLLGVLPGQGGTPATAENIVNYRRRLDEVLTSGEGCEFEFVMDALPVPEQEHYAVRFAAERDDQGNIHGVLSIWFDITERRRMEDQLKMKGHALDHSSEAMYLVGEQGRFVYVNEQACRTLGYSREELLTMGVPDIDSAFNGEFLHERPEKLREEGGSFVFETTHCRRDGSCFPVEIQLSELKYNGQVLGLTLARDISERKRAEKALRDSEKMLQEAQRIAHVGSWDVDMVNDRLTWSDEIFRIWEIDKTKFRADFAAFLETVHPDDRERVNRVYNEAVENHTLYEVEHRLLFPDGRVKHILERGEPQYDAQGKAVRFIGTSLDITERKRMEDAMAARERDFRSLAGNMPDNIARFDTQGRYIYVNPTHERLLGMKMEELIGQAIPDSHEQVKAGVMQVVATGQAIHAVRQPVMVGEVEELHDVSLVPEFDESGTLISVLGLGRDMTERYRMQETIAAREQEFRSLAENIPDHIVRWDVEGRFLYINPAHQRLLGKTVSELPPMPYADSDEPLHAAFRQVVSTGQPLQVEQCVTVAGHDEIHSVNLMPEFDADGRLVSVLALGRDMTHILRMQETIAAREQEFRSLAESSPDSIIRYDLEGRICYLNDLLLGLLGCSSPDEVLGKRPSEAWPDGRFAAIEQAAAKVVISKEMVSVELSVPNKADELSHILIYVVPEFDAQGDIVGSIAFGRDITSIKQLEADVIAREQEFRSLAENSPDPIYRYDRNCRRIYANQAVERLTGIPREAMLGKSPTEFAPVPSINAVRAQECIQSVLDSGQSAELELTFVAASGVAVSIHNVFVPELDADGKVQSVLCLGRDITERKQAEQALSERQAFLDSLFEAIPVPVFYKDREGHYLGFNRAYETVFGADRAQLIGKSVFDTHPRELAETYHAKDVEVFERRVALQQYEYQIKHSNGTLREVLFSKAAFADAQGEVQGLIGAVMDITDRKQAESELQSRFDQIIELNDRLEENARNLEEQAVELEASQEQLKLTEAWYRSILHSAPDGMMVIDERGVITLVNAQLGHMFGYTERELVGQKMEILVPEAVRAAHPAMREDFVRSMREERKPGLISNLYAQHRDGREFMVDISLARLPEMDGNFGAICASVRDISARKQLEDAISLREQEFRTLLENTPDVVVRYDRQCRRLYVNPAWERVNGLSREAVLNKSPSELCSVIKHMAEELEAMLRGVIESGLPNEIELIWEDELGAEICYMMNATPEFDNDGRVVSVLTMSRDITQRKLMERLLAAREQESRTLLENTPDTIARYDLACRRLYANSALESMVEGGQQALLGKTPSECPGGGNSVIYEEKLREVIASGKPTEFELSWASSDGEEIYSLISLTPEFDENGAVETVLAVGRDITELNAFRDKIHQMAFYDTLTSLPNRALFNDRLRQMIMDAEWHGQTAGVMMIDMDRFKEVNDTMGHAVGDELLCETGARLSACVRPYDTVARLGGDEFAILLPDIRTGDDLGNVAGKLLETFKDPFQLGGKEVFISGSIGIALYPDDSLEADDLLKFADSAMYYAKRSGRNNFRFYSGDLTESANERLTLESELRRAVERGELALHFQPKVCLATGAMIGSEALLRWNHPQRGSVSPVKFIPVAEDSGLIVELGEWVLYEACRMACEVNGTGRPLHKIAVNLSARQFQSGDLVRTVSEVLNETGCYPEWIELEITESLLLDEDGEVLETLKAFRCLGITIAIDDFGTGYSSLSYLARFPINTLKIDRSFINTLTTDHFRGELVKAIISIAKCLGQQVVAEGVESAAQAEFLRAHGCGIAQGFLFSKPRTGSELLGLPDRFDLACP